MKVKIITKQVIAVVAMVGIILSAVTIVIAPVKAKAINNHIPKTTLLPGSIRILIRKHKDHHHPYNRSDQKYSPHTKSPTNLNFQDSTVNDVFLSPTNAISSDRTLLIAENTGFISQQKK